MTEVTRLIRSLKQEWTHLNKLLQTTASGWLSLAFSYQGRTLPSINEAESHPSELQSPLSERQHVMGTMSSPGSGCLCSMNSLDSFHPAPFWIFLNVSVTLRQWDWCNCSLLIPLHLWPVITGTFGLECSSILLSCPRVAGQPSRNSFSVEKSRAAMSGNFRSWEPGVLHWSQAWSMSEAASLELGAPSQPSCAQRTRQHTIAWNTGHGQSSSSFFF